MGRNFNGSSSYLKVTSSPVAAEPLTMACWFWAANITANFNIMSISQGTTQGRWTLRAFGNTAGDPVEATSVSSGGSSGTSTINGFLANEWTHAAGVFASSASRTAYKNGVAATANTSSITVPTTDTLTAGISWHNSAANGYTNGKIAFAAVWAAALTAPEIARLQYTRPNLIRPESLVFYNPMRDQWTYDQARGLFLADNGPTNIADDPPQLSVTSRRLYTFATQPAAGGGTIFRNRTGSRSRILYAA